MEAAKTKWEIDTTHSEVTFKVKHLMISNVRGVFKEFGAVVYTSENNFLTSDIDFWLSLSSLDTGDKKRDAHLKSADFFNAKNHEKIKFKGTSLAKMDNIGGYELYGDLTIKNITKQIKLNVKFNGLVKDPDGNTKIAYSIIGKINRKTWGLNWNTLLEAGGVLVSEEVLINCEMELIK